MATDEAHSRRTELPLVCSDRGPNDVLLEIPNLPLIFHMHSSAPYPLRKGCSMVAGSRPSSLRTTERSSIVGKTIEHRGRTLCFGQNVHSVSFEQMLPQKVSWKIHYKNAESIMTMSSHSKASRVELVHGLAH